jgi:1-deoxy-D-xylulose-5-phosphate reductoisomerase
MVFCQDSTNGASFPEFSGATNTPMEEMACHPKVDLVVVATVGTSGLLPTLAALSAGKAVALASKETIVMAGALIAQKVSESGTILPVDSEPSAIWQCLQGDDQDVSRLIITASGGAFRDRPLEELAGVTPEEALRHPTWSMGRKITVDSATLMNKAFEVMEAHWLFDVPWDRIDVVLHPQSIVHSLVEFNDGSVKAQLARPDMRLPLQYALFYPRRMANQWALSLNIAKLGSLDFGSLDNERYPGFNIALDAAREGGTYPAALCAADDVAVSMFLDHKLGFLGIPDLVQRVLDEHTPGSESSLDDLQEASSWARRRAEELAGT